MVSVPRVAQGTGTLTDSWHHYKIAKRLPSRQLSRLDRRPNTQGCRFDPRLGHIWEATNEGINQWHNKWVPSFLSLKINK